MKHLNLKAQQHMDQPEADFANVNSDQLSGLTNIQ